MSQTLRTPATLCPRALRAAVFAVACVLLSAVTYAVAGHGSAPLWAVLAALAVVYPAAWAGSGRGRGPAAITALGTAATAAVPEPA
jgi:hypothetical protein